MYLYGGDLIIAVDAQSSAKSLTVSEAWKLTAAISPRPTVRAAITDAQGEVVNLYPPAGITPISADAPTLPWAIYLTDTKRRYRLLCFDLDGKTPEAAEAAAQDAAALARLLTDTGLAPVVCQSGPRGGRHVWVALAEGVEADLVHRLAHLAKALHRTLDLSPIKNTAAGCVRPPGAPHRHGGSSQVLSGDLDVLMAPTGTTAQVSAAVERLAQLVNDLATDANAEAFAADITQDTRRHDHIPGTKRELAPGAAAALRTDAAASDASAVLWRVLTAAATAHWEYGDIARLVKTAPGLEHVRTRKEDGGRRVARTAAEAARVLRRQWDKAVAYIASGRRAVGSDPTFDARADVIAHQVQDLQTRATAAPGRWNRGGGPADRRVFDALCTLALQALSADVEADTRRLALMVGIGRETARTALLRLAEDGWITRTQEAEGARAARWKIGASDVINSNSTSARSQIAHRPPGSGAAARNALLLELTERTNAAAHDLFTLGALGLHSGNLFARCTDSPLSLEDLTYLAGADLTQTARTLNRLTDAGVLLLGRDGWKRPAHDRRDAVATEYGVTGRLAARAERYAFEREMWAWWQAELSWMNTHPAERATRPGLGQLTLVPELGPAPRPIHPRTASGRADYRAARAHLTGDPLPQRPRPVLVSEAERLIVEILGGVAIETIPLDYTTPEPTAHPLMARSRSGRGSQEAERRPVRFVG